MRAVTAALLLATAWYVAPAGLDGSEDWQRAATAMALVSAAGLALALARDGRDGAANGGTTLIPSLRLQGPIPADCCSGVRVCGGKGALSWDADSFHCARRKFATATASVSRPRQPVRAYRPVHGRPTRSWPLRASTGTGCYGAPRPVQIIPSVLPADFGQLGRDCKALEDAGCDRIQFDVMDGNFVPNLTFGPDTIRWCRGYTTLPFETQLMVSEECTDAMLDQFVNVTKGPNGEPGVVIVHVEACTHLHRALGRIRAAGGSPSVALNPHTPAEMIENVLDMVDHVLVMTVNPGFGGQAYIPTMTNKIRKIRKWIVDGGHDVDIEVDGGIKATKETVGACAQAGANCFIAGSGLFAYDDMAQGVKDLTALALAGQKGE